MSSGWLAGIDAERDGRNCGSGSTKSRVNESKGSSSHCAIVVVHGETTFRQILCATLNGARPSQRPVLSRIRSRAARSFSTMTACSNCDTAPRTCRINTRVGSPSSALRPKGGRHRFVPLTPRLALALHAGRHLRGPRGVHILRHTFCSHLAMRGAAARAIQELAAHEDLSTPQRYMHVSPAAIEDAIRLWGDHGTAPTFDNMLATVVGATGGPPSLIAAPPDSAKTLSPLTLAPQIGAAIPRPVFGTSALQELV